MDLSNPRDEARKGDLAVRVKTNLKDLNWISNLKEKAAEKALRQKPRSD